MRNKKIAAELILILVILGIVFTFSAAYAQWDYSSSGVTLPQGTGLSEKSIEIILTTFLKWLLRIVGVIALIGFVVSGIMYLVSAGNDEMITKAKSYMMYSLIGITVALASFVVVQAVDAILKATGGY